MGIVLVARLSFLSFTHSVIHNIGAATARNKSEPKCHTDSTDDDVDLFNNNRSI